jgi:hypothetical protein
MGGKFWQGSANLEVRLRSSCGCHIFLHQNREIRFQARSVFCGITQQRFDKATFPQAEVPMDSSVRESMQPAYRLLHEKLFKFVSGHRYRWG